MLRRPTVLQGYSIASTRRRGLAKAAACADRQRTAATARLFRRRLRQPIAKRPISFLTSTRVMKTSSRRNFNPSCSPMKDSAHLGIALALVIGSARREDPLGSKEGRHDGNTL